MYRALILGAYRRRIGDPIGNFETCRRTFHYTFDDVTIDFLSNAISPISTPMHNDTFGGTARHRLPASRSKPRLPLLGWVEIDSEGMGYQEGKG